MPIPLSAAEVLNREFLEIRARLLQVAAALDRLDRAAGAAGESVDTDPRLERIHRALAVLDADEPGRAEQIQMIFSRDYSTGWRGDFGLANGRH
jgi:hypothetical protein